MNAGNIISRKIFGIADHFGVVYRGGDREECRIIHMQPVDSAAKQVRIIFSTLEEFLNGEEEFKIHNPEYNLEDQRDFFKRVNAWLRCTLEPYCLINNNCEHFANWLVYREPVSPQSVAGREIVEKILKDSGAAKSLIDTVINLPQFNSLEARRAYYEKRERELL